jgi:hypothetical protein
MEGNSLYIQVVNKRTTNLKKQLLEKKTLSGHEKAILCLIYATQMDLKNYEGYRKDILSGELSENDVQILREARLLIMLLQHAPIGDLRKEAFAIHQSNKDAIFAISTLAQLDFIQGNVQKAINEYELILEKYPEATWVYRFIAYHLLAAKRYKDSSRYIRHIEDPTVRYLFALFSKILLPFSAVIFLVSVAFLLLLPVITSFAVMTLFGAAMVLFGVYLRYKREHLAGKLLGNLFVSTIFIYVSVTILRQVFSAS